MIRVLVVDDHAFVRAQITRVMSEAPGIVVVGECTDGADVPGVAALVQPDVVLMDMRMPKTSGAVATAQLMAQQSSSRVMMLTGSPNRSTLAAAAMAGAVGFLPKDCGAHRLVSAVRTVAAGGTAWPDDDAKP
jgi:DNA-binding NarL/FixJ family response regulator